MTSTEEFVEFAETHVAALRRMAFLLCGNWHTAEDLAQTALAKVFVSWRKIRRQDAVYAYATRTLINCYLAHRRLKRSGEVLRSWLPEAPGRGPVARDTDDAARRAGHVPAKLPGGGGAALLGGPECGPGGGHARLLAGRREEPERPRARQAAGGARGCRWTRPAQRAHRNGDPR